MTEGHIDRGFGVGFVSSSGQKQATMKDVAL